MHRGASACALRELGASVSSTYGTNGGSVGAGVASSEATFTCAAAARSCGSTLLASAPLRAVRLLRFNACAGAVWARRTRGTGWDGWNGRGALHV
jgi:hypothetical protein